MLARTTKQFCELNLCELKAIFVNELRKIRNQFIRITQLKE